MQSLHPQGVYKYSATLVCCFAEESYSHPWSTRPSTSTVRHLFAVLLQSLNSYSHPPPIRLATSTKQSICFAAESYSLGPQSRLLVQCGICLLYCCSHPLSTMSSTSTMQHAFVAVESYNHPPSIRPSTSTTQTVFVLLLQSYSHPCVLRPGAAALCV